MAARKLSLGLGVIEGQCVRRLTFFDPILDGRQIVDLKATVAKRLGQNPNPTAQGLDQDGSYRNPRYWLSAMLAF